MHKLFYMYIYVYNLIAPRIPPGHEQLFGESDVQRYGSFGWYSRYGSYAVKTKSVFHVLFFSG